jgi:hypothetical protein
MTRQAEIAIDVLVLCALKTGTAAPVMVDSNIGGVLGQDTATPAFSALRRAAWETYLSTFDGFTIADLVAHPKHSRTNCLDCHLTRLARHGRTMSRLHDHVGCRTPFSGPDAGASA